MKLFQAFALLAATASIAQKEAPAEALLYGYIVDSDSPNFVRKKLKLFDVPVDEIPVSPYDTFAGTFECRDTTKAEEESIAASLSVEGSYEGFSGGVDMSATSSKSSTVKTSRCDVSLIARRYQATSTWIIKPQERTRDNVKDFIKTQDPSQIYETLGHFYATQVDLGGRYTLSHFVEMTKYDSTSTIKTELTAQYGVSGLASVGVTTGVSYGTSAYNSASHTKTSIHAEGGDTSIWLGANMKSDADVLRTQQKWRDSFNDDNLFPSGFQLQPIWKLVEKFDAKKGAVVEARLKEEWARNKPKASTDFVPCLDASGVYSTWCPAYGNMYAIQLAQNQACGGTGLRPGVAYLWTYTVKDDSITLSSGTKGRITGYQSNFDQPARVSAQPGYQIKFDNGCVYTYSHPGMESNTSLVPRAPAQIMV